MGINIAFPIDYIGPEPLYGASTGSFGVGVGAPPSAGEFTKIEGPDIEPTPMSPPEIEMKDPQIERLKQYLMHEIDTCENERWNQIEKFARLKQKYRTKFPQLPKNFPIPNSAQITIPVIKTNVDVLTSRLHQTVMAADPLASVRTLDDMSQDFANDWELFLKKYDEEILDIEEVLDTAVTESIKLGTSVVEVTRCLDKKKVVRYDAMAGKYIQETKEVYNGPILYNIPIEDYWQRVAYQDPQKAPWCGKCIRPTWSEIKDMALSGELNPEEINNIWKMPQANYPETIKQDEKQEDIPPQDWQPYRLFELFLRWDVDGDGIDEELIVYWHQESRTILRRKFNTFRNGQRPFEVFRYKKIEYRFYGEGMAEILEQLQDEISTQHNQRLDNATIAALKLILTARSIQGLRPGDPLWPGKIVKTNNPAQDVVALALGEIYPSTIQNEQMAQAYAREASGVGDALMGNAQPVSRTTAAAQLSLLEETNRRFDKTLKGYRRNVRGIHNKLTDLFNQTGTYGLATTWFGQFRGERLDSFITMPADALSGKIKITVTSTKATINREVELQTNIALMGLIVQHGEQLMGLTQALAPQVLPVVAHELLAAIRPVWKKVLQYSDSPNPDEGIRVLAFLESVLPSPENLGGMAQGTPPGAPGGPTAAGGGNGANGSGTVSSPTATPASRLGDIMQSIGQANNGLPTVGPRRR